MRVSAFRLIEGPPVDVRLPVCCGSPSHLYRQAIDLAADVRKLCFATPTRTFQPSLLTGAFLEADVAHWARGFRS